MFVFSLLAKFEACASVLVRIDSAAGFSAQSAVFRTGASTLPIRIGIWAGSEQIRGGSHVRRLEEMARNER